MIKTHIPSKEEIKAFLNKIENRIHKNNQSTWSPQKQEPRL